MHFDVHFAIDQFTKISVVVPDLSKNTKQYKHIEEWNRFDTAYFRIETNTICLDIKRDSILTSLIEFYNVIDIALTYTTSIAHYMSPGTIGKEHALPSTQVQC